MCTDVLWNFGKFTQCFFKVRLKPTELVLIYCFVDGFYVRQVLKSAGRIDVKQDEPYGDITLKLTAKI